MASALPPLILPAYTVVGNISGSDGLAAAIPIPTLLATSPTPSNVSAATYSIAALDECVIFNGTGCTLTLPLASSFAGRELNLRTIVASAVISNSSNVIPLIGGAAGTAILAATAGKWARLFSDGTNWQIMAGN